MPAPASYRTVAGDPYVLKVSVENDQAPGAIDANIVSGTTAALVDTTATTVIAGAASVKLHITHVLVQNSHATVGTWVQLLEETSGTVLYNVYAAATGGGASLSLPVPLIVPTAAKALQAKCVTTGANVMVSASGYKA